MKAIRIDGQTPGGKRSKLADLLPLATPLSVQIFPVYACNLSCNYCIHSVPVNLRGYITDKAVMDYALYKKTIDDLTQFPQKLKMLRFAGTGEPLLHKELAQMIAYAKEKDIAESIDIVTNGLGLTHQISQALVEAGVDKIRVSIQGLNDEAYAFTKQKGVFSALVEKLKFLYNHRQQTKIYIKIIDCALQVGEEEEFMNLFGDICDFIAIEHLIPAVSQIDYNQFAGVPIKNLTQNGVCISEAKVCPQPFYMMQLNPDGKIVPCCAMETAYILGDVANQSMQEIWNGTTLQEFRINQLIKNKEIYSVCKKCKQYQYAMFEEDVLDLYAVELLKKFKGEAK